MFLYVYVWFGIMEIVFCNCTKNLDHQRTVNVSRLCSTSGVGIAWLVYSWNYRHPHLTLLFTTCVFCFKINWLGPQTVLQCYMCDICLSLVFFVYNIAFIAYICCRCISIFTWMIITMMVRMMIGTIQIQRTENIAQLENVAMLRLRLEVRPMGNLSFCALMTTGDSILTRVGVGVPLCVCLQNFVLTIGGVMTSSIFQDGCNKVRNLLSGSGLVMHSFKKVETYDTYAAKIEQNAIVIVASWGYQNAQNSFCAGVMPRTTLGS